MLKLIKLDENMEEMFMEYTKEWLENNEEIITFSVRSSEMNYIEWLEKSIELERKETCPENLVPAHTYFLVNEIPKIIGAVNIRTELNDFLLRMGGHIGYGIRPSERRKGYATELLRLALLESKAIGLEKVLVTCDKENVGSAQTIIKNLGVLENEVQESNRVTQRYWINL